MNNQRKTYYVYVGSIPSEVGKQDIVRFFARQGFAIQINRKKSKPMKRFFVVETTDYDAYYAILHIKRPRIGSSIIQITPFLNGKEKLAYDAAQLNKKVYVGNIPIDATQNDLFDFFERFGDVRMCYIANQKPFSSFKYGFVTFFNEKDAQNLIDLDKVMFRNSVITFKEFSYGNRLKIYQEQQKSTSLRHFATPYQNNTHSNSNSSSRGSRLYSDQSSSEMFA